MLQIASAPLPSDLDRAARGQGNRLLILGLGDGSVLEQIRAHLLLRTKPAILLLLANEPEPSNTEGIEVARCRDAAEVLLFVQSRWGRAKCIPAVAGLSIIASHPLSHPSAQALRQQVSIQLIDRPAACGNDIHDGLDGIRHASANASHLLAAPDLSDLRAQLGGTPAISIAAGPSLVQHLETLRTLQDRCLLVACDAVYPGLIEAGITPHLVTPLERDQGPVHLLSERVSNSSTWFAGLPVIEPEAVAAFGDRQLLVPGSDTLYDWYCPGVEQLFTGSSTGVLSMTVCMLACSGPIYLVGHDLALAADRTHWTGAEHSSRCMLAARSGRATTDLTDGNAERLVPGNAGGLVPSLVWWDRFRQEIGGMATWLQAQHGRFVYNVNMVTRTGAHIDGCQAARLPRAQALPKLTDFNRLPRHPERLRTWQHGLQQLPAEWTQLAVILEQGLAACDQALIAGPEAWLALDPLAAIAPTRLPPAHAKLISYLLRSALLGGAIEQHACHRYRHPQQAALQRLLLGRRLLDQLRDVHRHLQPEIQELLHVGQC